MPNSQYTSNGSVQAIAGTQSGTAYSNNNKGAALQNTVFMHLKIKCLKFKCYSKRFEHGYRLKKLFIKNKNNTLQIHIRNPCKNI